MTPSDHVGTVTFARFENSTKYLLHIHGTRRPSGMPALRAISRPSIFNYLEDTKINKLCESARSQSWPVVDALRVRISNEGIDT